MVSDKGSEESSLLTVEQKERESFSCRAQTVAYARHSLNRESVTSIILNIMGTEVKNTDTPLSLKKFHISEDYGFILPEPLVGHYTLCNIM